MMNKIFSFLIISSVCFASGTLLIAQPGSPSELYEIVGQIGADEDDYNRKYTLRYTDEYFDKMLGLYSRWQEGIDTIDFQRLSTQGRADYILLKNHIDRQVYFLKEELQELRAVDHALTFADNLYPFLKSRRNGTSPDYPKLAKKVDQTILEIDQLQKAMEHRTPTI